MTVETESNFSKIWGNIQQHKVGGVLKVPVFELEPVMKRSDNLTVFEEGLRFGGVMETDHAKACVTIAASAHVPPTVPKREFIRKAKEVFSTEPQLPGGADNVELLPPQAIIWWMLKSDKQKGEFSDFLALSKMDPLTQQEFYNVIGRQLFNAASFVNSLKGNSIIWGSWGNGSMDERGAAGLSRGVPTNKIGHCHAVHIQEAQTILKPREGETSARDVVNFIAPWTGVIMDQFGDAIGDLVERSLTKSFADGPQICVRRQSPDENDESSLAGKYHGFDIRFGSTVGVEAGIKALVVTAGTLEDFYQMLISKHAEYYLTTGNSHAQADTLQKLFTDLRQRGIDDIVADRVTRFVTAIKPTRIQLDNWINQGYTNLLGLYNRYLRMSGYIQKSEFSNPTVYQELVADTYRSSDELGIIERTLPVHASAWYLMEKYFIEKDNLLINKLKVFPSLASTIAAPERIIGGVQKRPLS